ncbi:MAG: ABC transporter substrate-binding protein [Zoogloeaceae bacterium]|nr:ABC transporter substrate-binding protein [Zoogloeaceae bacterium]
MKRRPQRIVCLSTETVEVLYRLGEEDRIVGISGFTVRPPRARKEKPKVSAFSTADVGKILAVAPDLVLAFSDLQADMVREVVKAGVAAHVFNHRSVEGILAMVDTVGALVGAAEAAAELVASLEDTLAAARSAGEALAARLGRRPRVYFEEWDEPMISGIRWVSELIAIAGGEDIFADRAGAPNAKERIIADPAEVIARAPDLILGSWCGKHFRPERVTGRPGWASIPAVIHGQVHEIKSAIILAPGLAAIEEGLPALAACLAALDDGAKRGNQFPAPRF